MAKDQSGFLLPGAAGFGEVVAARVIAHELTIVGSHGISRSGLEGVLDLTARGHLRPDQLIRERVDLAGGVDLLTRLERFAIASWTAVSSLRASSSFSSSASIRDRNHIAFSRSRARPSAWWSAIACPNARRSFA